MLVALEDSSELGGVGTAGAKVISRGATELGLETSLLRTGEEEHFLKCVLMLLDWLKRSPHLEQE